MIKPIQNKKEGFGLFKGVLIAHLILILHGLFIIGLLVVVLLFRGFIYYAGWIFLGGTLLIAALGYGLYRRLKKEGKSLAEFLNSPLFRGKTIEVSLLGGLASLKVGHDDSDRIAGKELPGPPQPLLEDAGEIRVRELSELARLLEKKLITRDEYDQAKHRILHH